jgi:hypothetical protein
MAKQTPYRIAGPVRLQTDITTVYSVPYNSKATVNSIQFFNQSGSPRTVTFALGVDSGQTRVYTEVIPANGQLNFRVGYALEDNGEIQASVDLNYAVMMTVNGTELLGDQTGLPMPGISGNWVLVFQDDFDGPVNSAPNLNNWGYWLDGQMRNAAINSYKNTFLDGSGNLQLRVTNADIGYGAGVITAGGLTTETLKIFGVGCYFEARCKITSGWFGWWIQSPLMDGIVSPAEDGTEMDLIESCCPGPVHHAVHWGGYGSGHMFETFNPTVDQTQFNTYGMQWTPTAYNFNTNGVVDWVFTDAISERRDQFVRLTMEDNGDYTSGDVRVDYVRIWRPRFGWTGD